MLRDCDVGAHAYQRADLRDRAALMGARRAAEGGREGGGEDLRIYNHWLVGLGGGGVELIDTGLEISHQSEQLRQLRVRLRRLIKLYPVTTHAIRRAARERLARAVAALTLAARAAAEGEVRLHIRLPAPRRAESGARAHQQGRERPPSRPLHEACHACCCGVVGHAPRRGKFV